MSDNAIKAIETIYNGYRFRSRLEARWAVFFDALRIPYEYEPEGFDLGDTCWYLPDFWLPRQESWYEVKPSWMGQDSKDALKASELAFQSGHDVYVSCGSEFHPLGMNEYYELVGQEIRVYTPQRGESGDSLRQWVYCSREDQYFLDNHPCPCGGPTYEDHVNTWAGIIDAYKVARSARFEHGERGRS